MYALTSASSAAPTRTGATECERAPIRPALAGAAGTADVQATLEITTGVPHVFQNFTGILDDADEALDRCGRFLSQHLPAPTQPGGISTGTTTR